MTGTSEPSIGDSIDIITSVLGGSRYRKRRPPRPQHGSTVIVRPAITSFDVVDCLTQVPTPICARRWAAEVTATATASAHPSPIDGRVTFSSSWGGIDSTPANLSARAKYGK